jgi:hypothetical protein
MKKHILFLVVCFFLASFVHAQFSYGLKAGGARTSLPGDFSNNSKAGFYAGALGAFQLKKSFSLQAELYYSAQGNKKMILWGDMWDPVYGYYSSGAKGKMIYRLNYINLPILVKYQHTSGFFVQAGAQAGLLVSAKVKTPKTTVDIKDYYRTFDLSWTIGAGYQLKNGLGVDLRYNRSVKNIYKKEQYSYYDIRNSVVQLGLFYSWKKS